MEESATLFIKPTEWEVNNSRITRLKYYDTIWFSRRISIYHYQVAPYASKASVASSINQLRRVHAIYINFLKSKLFFVYTMGGKWHHPLDEYTHPEYVNSCIKPLEFITDE